MAKKAVVLINLGSPDSTSVADVRRYLREFLSDERVIDSPALVRAFVLNCFILPTRPKQSAHAYKQVWLSEGSPLIVTSIKQQELLQGKVSLPVELAMRYGNPSIPSVMKKIADNGITELFVIPLYPHYAMSSYETVVVKVSEEANKLGDRRPALTYLQPFFNDPEYINTLAKTSEDHLTDPFDHLLFSFHGVPERHLRKGDPSHAHCLTCPNCCETAHPAHATCYRHQCFTTAHLFAEKMGIPKSRYSIAFQSRLGRDPWLQPYTDKTLAALAGKGIKRIRVICPAFVTDCLETLEEIAMGGKETFIEAGGEDFKLVPCMNDHPAFIDYLTQHINRWQEK